MQHDQGNIRSLWNPPSGDYLLGMTPAAARVTINKTTMNKYTHFAGHFDGHHNAAVQYRVLYLMENVHGIPRSHWMPPLGKYLL
jgi:hypothetical protein